MKISFAATRPAGDYALVIPSAGSERPGLASLGAASNAVETAIKRQRFDGEANSVVEHIVDGDNPHRLLVVGTGKGVPPAEAAEKLGGVAAARLLVSGETHAVLLRAPDLPAQAVPVGDLGESLAFRICAASRNARAVELLEVRGNLRDDFASLLGREIEAGESFGDETFEIRHRKTSSGG